jgi:glycosyltransferase involved in cell wall biosynthesis
VLIEACGKLKERGRLFECIIAGEPRSAQEQQHLSRMVSDLGLEEMVKFKGRVEGDAKWGLFERADIFCMPTFYSAEAFPLVMLEAIMCGLPAIATNWRGIPDIIEDEISGMLVEPHDVDAMVDAIEKLIISPEYRERLGRAGRSRFVEKFTVAAFQSQMERAFLSIVDTK